MSRDRWSLLWVHCLLIGAVMNAHGHHSRSAFDLSKTVVVDGVVTEVGWTNPHYYLSVRDESSGEPVTWTFEGHSIPGLVRNGWRRDTMTAGSRVSVTANPNTQAGVLFGLINHVTRQDGKTFYSFRPTDEMLVQPQAPLLPSTDFSGTWRLIRSLRSNLVGGFEPPVQWPLTEHARAEVARFDLRNDPSLNCEPRGLPRMLSWPYSQRWHTEGDDFAISLEHATETRRLVADPQVVLPPATDDLGQARILSRGPDELIVETKGFSPKLWGLTRGVSSGEGKVLTEHYRLVEEGFRLELTVTMVDPLALTAPVVETLNYAKVRDFEFAEEPPCDVRTARRHLEFENR